VETCVVDFGHITETAEFLAVITGRPLCVVDASGGDLKVDRTQVVELLSNKRSLPFNASLPDMTRLRDKPTDYDTDLEVMSTHSDAHDESAYKLPSHLQACNMCTFTIAYIPRRWHLTSNLFTRFGHSSLGKLTRQLSYRKHARAMRPIYGCPEKFRESSLRTRLLFPKFVMGFLFPSILRMCEVRSFTRS